MTTVLIVDDNETYRTAFRRNLMLRDYDVLEAEHAEDALRVLDKDQADIVVTDLSMRTPTEGLDLIRSIKQVDPLLPVVLISAVGTFEEGSLAKELGADRVLMKQKLDEQIEDLYDAIDSAKERSGRLRSDRRWIEDVVAKGDGIGEQETGKLRELIATPNQHPVIMAEAYDALAMATEGEIRRSLAQELESAEATALEAVDKELKEALPEFGRFAPETQKELRTAEFFFQRQENSPKNQSVDFSRNIGFSYCFAVENEAKVRLRKRLQKFLADKTSVRLIKQLIDNRSGQLDLFYHQYLLRLEQQISFDFTVDNVRQVFQRILEHESRYKPDGLKALGIMVVCFGRDYKVKTLKSEVKVDNPLHLKAFDSDQEVLRFAHLLVSLQHLRNPYIHPEISEMEKVSKIRETALECLKAISRLA